MLETLTFVCALVACVLLAILLLRKPVRPDLSELFPRFDAVRDEVRRVEQALRDETSRAIGGLRSELGSQHEAFRQGLAQANEKDRAELRAQLAEQQGILRETLATARTAQATQLNDFATRLDALATAVTGQLAELRASVDTRLRENAETTSLALSRTRSELADSATAARTEARAQATEFQQKTAAKLDDSRAAQNTQLGDFATRLGQLQTATTEQLTLIRNALDQKLAELSTQNAAKLDEMRATVDERLKSTLEQRLGESFKLVSDRLNSVTLALGEMQQIANGVGDLKRVLTNVKTRGTWGEVQLAALLEQVLTRDQYEANVAPIPGSAARVEFAIKLPGQGDSKQPVWLPLDAKFPIEDYQRLSEAAERADTEAVAVASLALGNRVRDFAKTIAEKYISPPYTTDFALLFLPTEGLYAEVLRQPGLSEQIQRQHRVIVVGPTTLAALLNSLQMGFRTLAIQQRSSEVWNVLGAVKTEFAKFGEVLDKVKDKLDSASKEIDKTGVRSRAIERQLRKVEELSPEQAAQILPAVLPPDLGKDEG